MSLGQTVKNVLRGLLVWFVLLAAWALYAGFGRRRRN